MRNFLTVLYCSFPSSCNAKHHALYKHVHARLFSNRFSVTKTHSQHFRHAYTYSLTATEYHETLYRVFYRTAHMRTILAHDHDALHCKNLENRNTEIFRLVVRACATYFCRITVIRKQIYGFTWQRDCQPT